MSSASGLFDAFTTTAEQVGATTKRLEKAAVLGAYFAGLSDDDLNLAARWFAGHLFPLHDARTVSVGGAALVSALVTASGADENHVRTRLVARGDAGDVARELWGENPDLAARIPSLTLADVAHFLETLAATSGTKNKQVLILTMLGRAAQNEAKYIVKLLSGDLRIGLKEGAVEDALARLAGITVGEVQAANMLTGDIGQTALMARHNRLGEASLTLFHPVKFMLATAAADLAEVARQMPETFIVEDKFDGIRAQAHIGKNETIGSANGEIVARLYTRTLDEVSHSFPELAAPLCALVCDGEGGLILDGEIVPVSPSDPSRILPFQSLQPRLGRKLLSDETLAQVPVAFIAYDALMGGPRSAGTDGGGRILTGAPLRERRAFLESLPVSGPTVRRADSRTFTNVSDLDAEFAAARVRNNEGLMVKDPGSVYKPGKRGRDWLKIKRTRATLDVVVTAAQVGDGRRARFLSDYTFAVRASETDPTLLNVGKAYSGLTDKEVEELSQWFKAHTIAEYAHGKVRTVEPQIVFEITFDRVQPSARHKSGYALRFPRIVRIRTDKPPHEIDTLDTVRKLAEGESGQTGETDTE